MLIVVWFGFFWFDFSLVNQQSRVIIPAKRQEKTIIIKLNWVFMIPNKNLVLKQENKFLNYVEFQGLSIATIP